MLESSFPIDKNNMSHYSAFPSPLELAASLRQKRGFVWLDSLAPQKTSQTLAKTVTPRQQGLSILAVEPDLLIEGKSKDWHLLEEELERRRATEVHSGFSSKFQSHHRKKTNATVASSQSFLHLPEENSGAAIGYVRFDGSFCFGFYEKTYRHYSRATISQWLTPLPIILPWKEKENALEPLSFQSNLTAEEYCQKVCSVQQEIIAGNIYQACLAHCFKAPFEEDPWLLYLKLRKNNPAPFAAYLDLGQEKILSSSPECFLKIEGRQISTYPIKGTRPRGNTRTEDDRQRFELENSEKEKAELMMITDLERNDLSKVTEYGSVITPQLLTLKSYPHVFHLVSKIQGKLCPSVTAAQALMACFPGGSISGAPKKKAIEIIQRLEALDRGIFSGAIGYFGFNGTSQFNIAIRTMVLDQNIVSLHVGAGITSDSIPEEEWKETLHKAAGILT